MKILILANFDVGLYNFRSELIEEIIKMGHSVYIALPYGEKVDLLVEKGCSFVGVDVDRRGINPIKDLKLILRYCGLLAKIKPDRVISYTIKPNIYGGIACRLKNVPLYANITGLGTAFQGNGLLTKLVTFLYKLGLKKACKVFFENKEDRDILVKRKIVPINKTCCLNGAGINLEKYPFHPYPKDDTINFLFIGRIMKEKGIDEYFYAAKRLKNEGYNVVCNVIGMFEENYKDIVDRLHKEGIICFYGYQNDVRPFIKKSHCFVLPSYHEGMANTLLECGAMGRPLITSNIHGCLEAVNDGVNGYLCEVRNGDALYENMKLFIELTYEEKTKMGRASYEHIASIFDKKMIVRETIEEIFDE